MRVATTQEAKNGNSNDTVMTPRRTKELVQTMIKDGPGGNEIDPIFKASPAYNITNSDIAKWNNQSGFSGDYNDLTNKLTAGKNISIDTNNKISTTDNIECSKLIATGKVSCASLNTTNSIESTGSLGVTGFSSLDGGLKVSNNLQVNNMINTTGDIISGGKIIADNDLVLNKNNITLTIDPCDVDSNTAYTTNSFCHSFNKDVKINGVTTSKELVTSGKANIGGELSVVGNAVVGGDTIIGKLDCGDINSVGLHTCNKLDVADEATVHGNLNVVGNLTDNGDIISLQNIVSSAAIAAGTNLSTGEGNLLLNKENKNLTISPNDTDGNASYITDANSHSFNKDIKIKGDAYGGTNGDRRIAYFDEISGGGEVEVLDTLTSTSPTSALSANMGKTLNDNKVDKTNIKNNYSNSNLDTYSSQYSNEHNLTISPSEPANKTGMWVKASKNLFNKNSSENVAGYLNNKGEIVSANSDTTSGYIEVKPNSEIRKTTRNGIAQYDSNKAFIKYQYDSFAKTEPNCKYIRISVVNKNKDNEMVKYGWESINFEPYVDKEVLTYNGYSYENLLDIKKVNYELNKEQAKDDSPIYKTHYMQIGYFDIYNTSSGKWSWATLLINSNFWGNQHNSANIITINATDYVDVTNLRVGGVTTNGNFYFKKVDKKVYLFAVVWNGNGFGYWGTTILSQHNCTWHFEPKYNLDKGGDWVDVVKIGA